MIAKAYSVAGKAAIRAVAVMNGNDDQTITAFNAFGDLVAHPRATPSFLPGKGACDGSAFKPLVDHAHERTGVLELDLFPQAAILRCRGSPFVHWPDTGRNCPAFRMWFTRKMSA